MKQEINAFEKFGGNIHRYLTIEIDGKMMLMETNGRGKGRYLMLEDGSIVKIKKFGQSRRMSYTPIQTLVQVFINNRWTVVDKINIMSPIAEMGTELPEFTIIYKMHVALTKYDEKFDRKASIKKKYLSEYIK